MEVQSNRPDPSARGMFLDAPSGRLFAVHHGPADADTARGQVLFVPPFNEEMNRCRSMMTLQAAQFAALGYGTLVVDPFGTGDSAGQYLDARWELWLNDLETAYQWLDRQPGGCRGILGIRLGAMLAAEFVERSKLPHIAMMYWQPVVDGKIHLTQFLRVRMAAQLDRTHLPKETTASMRKQLGEGVHVEVGGYDIHSDLARAMDDARLADRALPASTHVLWIENAGLTGNSLAPPSEKVTSEWVRQGVSVDIVTTNGPAFWQLHERVTAPPILDATTSWFGRHTTGR
jgi:exosortase A-associated hydrolase 2